MSAKGKAKGAGAGNNHAMDENSNSRQLQQALYASLQQSSSISPALNTGMYVEQEKNEYIPYFGSSSANNGMGLHAQTTTTSSSTTTSSYTPPTPPIKILDVVDTDDIMK